MITYLIQDLAGKQLATPSTFWGADQFFFDNPSWVIIKHEKIKNQMVYTCHNHHRGQIQTHGIALLHTEDDGEQWILVYGHGCTNLEELQAYVDILHKTNFGVNSTACIVQLPFDEGKKS